MENGTILEYPHDFGKRLILPYDYLDTEDTRYLYGAVNNLIVPKLQDIIRSGRKKGNVPFLDDVFFIMKKYRESLNFNDMKWFADRYLMIIKKKYMFHDRIRKILNHENTGWDDLKLLIQQNLSIEIEFFAYGALIKEFAEKIANYMIHVDPSMEESIIVSSWSFYDELLVSLDRYNAWSYERAELLRDFFNGEEEFYEEFLKTFDNNQLNHIRAPASHTSVWFVANPELYKRMMALIHIDNIIDKYIASKKMFLHDILWMYKMEFGVVENLGDDKIEQVLDKVFKNYNQASSNECWKLTEDTPEVTDLIGVLVGGTWTTGNKAYNLSILINHGINIPRWFIIQTEALQQLDTKIMTQWKKEQILSQFKQNLWEKVVVRSNYIWEDGAQKSFAWIFQSFVDVDVENVFEYIEQVITPCEWIDDYTNFKTVKPGVIIQEFIRWEYSWVAFVQWDEIIIEMLEWLNEDLVSWKMTPESFEYRNWGFEKFGNIHIDPQELQWYIDTFKSIYQIFWKNDVDIEFTIRDSKIYILQARYTTSRVVINNDILSSNIDWDFNGSKLVSRGDFSGELIVIESPKDLDKIKKKSVIVTNKLYTELALKTGYVSGIISEEWWYLAHLSLICREMHIPVVTNIRGITTLCKWYSNVSFENNFLTFSI